jgi:lysophospholipase L1-like esterase
LDPIWRAGVIHRESLVCVRDDEGQPAVGKLLFPAEKILAVHSADGRQTFEAGRDFELSPGGRQLSLLPKSRIPQLGAADLFPPKGAPRSIPHKTGDPTRSVLFDNGHWFHDQQIEVSYERAAEKWPGVTPTLATKELPKTIARLRDKKKLTLAVSGDSISEGYNASGFSKAPPWMPPYPDLVAAQLRQTYATDVELRNRAVGGWNVGRGVNDLDALLATSPDLIIIAYGMNDVGGRNPEGFRAAIGTMLEKIRKMRPDAEVILVPSMLGNADWAPTPREMFGPYRDALKSFVGPGVALADMTDLWQNLLKHKRDIDVNGNGVNHPSDFGHRLYAQVILSLLVEPKESQ